MRPKKDIDSEKDRIIERFQNGESASTIGTTYKVSECTIRRRLQEWDIKRRVAPVSSFDDIQRLKALIAILFLVI
jgi:DNA invertase Pin-like site-specific DNA recombinase